MNDQLNEQPLVELIREISAAALSGALRLSHERVKLAVYFDAGEIVYAASNLRIHRLSECLRRWGVVTAEQLEQIGTRASDVEFGSALVSTGALTPQALEEMSQRQVVDVLRPALLWIHGVWNFDPRVRYMGGIRVRVEMTELLMESARRLPVEFVGSRFKDRRNDKLSPAEQAPVNLDLQPTEAFVLSRAYEPISVYDLLTIGGLPEAETLQAVYALCFGGFLRRDGWPKAFTPEAIAKAHAINAAQAKAAPPPPVSATTPLVEETRAAEKPVEVEEEVVAVDEARELEDMFMRLAGATNYYQILGISRTSTPDIIKRTYHRLAKRFHPDRFHHDADTALHARVGAAFAQIAHAYEGLKDKQSRAVYDMKLEREAAQARASEISSARQNAQNVGANAGRMASDQAGHGGASQSSSTSAHNQAEEKYQQGLAALKKGDGKLAVIVLGEAARLAPGQARYRAYYGRALASNPQSRRQAEAEIKAAIALDSATVSYRVMLAEFYRDMGMQRRAQAELERALSIDPRNAVARQMLESMQATK